MNVHYRILDCQRGKILPMNNLGRNIRAELARKGLTVSALAKELGCSESNMSRKLNGHRPLSSDSLLRIASFLEVTVAALTGEMLLAETETTPIVLPARAPTPPDERLVSLTAQEREERKQKVLEALTKRRPLPRQKDLAAEFKCSQATIAGIKKDLVAEGKITGNSPKVRQLFVDSVSAMCADFESSLVAA